MTDSANRPSTTKVKREEEVYDIEALSKGLREYGLTLNEAKVFLQLSRFGPDTASAIGKSLGLPRTQVYGVVSSLQSKGLIESSIDRPAKFSVLPIQSSLDLLIEAQRSRVALLQRSKDGLLKRWRMMHFPPPEREGEKLQLLKGSEQIYARVSEMIDRAEGEVDIVAFGPDLSRLLGAGPLSNTRKLRRRKMAIRILTDDSHRSYGVLSRLGERVQVQQVESTSSFAPHFVIVDRKELLMFTKSPTRSPAGRKAATALWTNGRNLVQSMMGLFKEMQGKMVTGLATPGETIAAAARTELTALRKQLVSELSIVGLDAKENMEIRGASGTTHRFDLGATMEGSKPIAVDLAFDAEEVGAAPVVALFAKRTDVESSVSSVTLVVRPRLSDSAKELARSYGIRVVELNP